MITAGSEEHQRLNAERECREKARTSSRVPLIFRGWEKEEGPAKETEMEQPGRKEKNVRTWDPGSQASVENVG